MTMGDKPAYSLGPHSVRPLRRLAGGRAPSDPAVFRPVVGAAAERFPSVADGPADAILAGPASRELGHDRRGPQDPPVGESLADRVAREPRSRIKPGNPLSRRFWAFGGWSGGIRGHRIACNARTRPPEG